MEEELRTLLGLFHTFDPVNMELAAQIAKGLDEAPDLEKQKIAYEFLEDFLKKRAWCYPPVVGKKCVYPAPTYPRNTRFGWAKQLIETETLYLGAVSLRKDAYPIELLELAPRIRTFCVENHNAQLPYFTAQLQDIRKLVLGFIQNAWFLQPEIFQLPALRSLSLGTGGVLRLDERFQNFQNLSYLSVGCSELQSNTGILETVQQLSIEASPTAMNKKNRFTGAALHRPFEFGNLLVSTPNLQSLQLIGRRIHDLPTPIPHFNQLKTLDLSHTNIQILAKKWKKFPKLNRLIIRGLNHFENFPFQLLELPDLKHLAILDNPQFSINSDWKHFKHLKTLKLGKSLLKAFFPFSHQKYSERHNPWDKAPYLKNYWREQLAVWLPNTKIILD